MIQSKPAIKLGDLHPDDVRIVIAWDDWEVGMSAFVPCINTDSAVKHATAAAALKGHTISCRVCIEAQHLGVRIWRIA